MRYSLATCCFAMTLVGSVAAFAQPGHGTPMPGWSCRMLNLTEAQSMDFSIHIPVRAQPSESSPPVGYASETVAVNTSAPEVNGFLEAMFPTGRTVWIAAKSLKPWHAAANPSAKCVPVTKANGKPGFDYPQ
jgi:hypothetical protein